MVKTITPPGEVSMQAPGFSLIGTDGQTHTLESVAGEQGLFVMFICNHCPFVQAVIDRAVAVANDAKALGVNTVAIMSNDTDAYPDDSFENMQVFAREHSFTFPYVIDESQEVAKAYGAVCTPDFFVFDKKGQLAYRGRIDEGRMEAPGADAPRELFDAIKAMVEAGGVPETQHPSIGCSIKWR